jgi:hypothetical protein
VGWEVRSHPDYFDALLVACLPSHCGLVNSSGCWVQAARGKVKAQGLRERRAGVEVQVDTGYWLPGQGGRDHIVKEKGTSAVWVSSG